ncbi:hypothetical protein [Micromonospora chokoriensis]|uniref:hypothetical protein n=1 Tax=Micromonospora chokoriensis TaxID=356851 RepID=UPI0004C41E25|nr:hypothetical protein [Micromonospora chokoriensis]
MIERACREHQIRKPDDHREFVALYGYDDTHAHLIDAAAGETGDPDQLSRASAILSELADRERHAMQILSGIRTD